MKHPISLIAGLTAASSALAHEGHGLPGLHGHASDAWGFVVLAVLVAAALWSARK